MQGCWNLCTLWLGLVVLLPPPAAAAVVCLAPVGVADDEDLGLRNEGGNHPSTVCVVSIRIPSFRAVAKTCTNSLFTFEELLPASWPFVKFFWCCFLRNAFARVVTLDSTELLPDDDGVGGVKGEIGDSGENGEKGENGDLTLLLVSLSPAWLLSLWLEKKLFCLLEQGEETVELLELSPAVGLVWIFFFVCCKPGRAGLALGSNSKMSTSLSKKFSNFDPHLQNQHLNFFCNSGLTLGAKKNRSPFKLGRSFFKGAVAI